MAKKKKKAARSGRDGGPNRSQLIRDFDKANPNVAPKDAVTRLNEANPDLERPITGTLVSQVRGKSSKKKKKAAKKKTSGRKAKTAKKKKGGRGRKKRVDGSEAVPLDSLLAAKAFVATSKDAEKAKEALDAAQKLQEACGGPDEAQQALAHYSKVTE
jgi:hypothetical protein